MKNINVLMVFWMCLISFQVSAQTIQLLDQKHQTPIINASYSYGTTRGISDNKGMIAITNDQQSTLVISHLNYGQLSIPSAEIASIIQRGTIYWSRLKFEIQPVSIIALHENLDDSLSILVNNQHRLSHDAAQVLAQVPEIALIRKSGNYGFDPVLRGFKYEQLNIVLDGAQSANAACPNRMDPPSSQIPVNMLSQISILKGPYSLRYGNAFGGTINFQTEQATYGQTQKVNGRLSGSYESNGTIYRSEGRIGFNSSAYDIKLFGALSSGTNYEDGDGREVQSGFYRNNFGSIMDFRLNDNQNIRLNVSHNYAKDVDFPALPMDLRKDDTWLGSINHNIWFNGQLQTWSTSIYSTYVDHLMDNFDKPTDPRIVDAVTAAKTLNYGGRTEGHWVFNSNQLYVGADFRGNKAEGERSRHFLMGPNTGNTVYDNVWQDAAINKMAVFGELQQNILQWQMVYASRIEYNQAQAHKPDDAFAAYYSSMSSNTINPSFSIGINRSLSSKWRAELWLGHAQRSGSLSERYINFLPIGVDPYEIIGNPLLDSEKNNQVDLSINYSSGSAQVQLTGFASLINDYISSEIRDDIPPKMPSSPGVRQYTNIKQAQLIGFEAAYLQKLPARLQHRLSLAYTHGENKDSNEPLAEIPPLDFRYVLSGRYFNNRLRPQLNLRHAWQQKRVALSYGESSTPAFTLLDASINYQFNKFIESNVAIHNILDETYYEHLSRSVKGSSEAIYAPGRSFVFTLVVNL